MPNENQETHINSIAQIITDENSNLKIRIFYTLPENLKASYQN